MSLNFSELKATAAKSAESCYPKTDSKTGAALLCRDGSIQGGFNILFPDGHKISATDMALSHSLSQGQERFFALALYTNEGISKDALKRLSLFGDMMVYITDGTNETQTTLKKLI